MNTQKFYSIGEAANRAGTTIETLRHYDRMPLTEIKKILNADFPEIISFLQSAETNIDIEIQRLSRAKEQISSLRQSLQEHSVDDSLCIHTKFFEQRAILLAEQLHEANVENFRRLHNDIYQMLGPTKKAEFSFDHSANLLMIPQHGMAGTMFAVCTKILRLSCLAISWCWGVLVL